ncbi:ribbon-helix-helix domain-containing protein [Lentisphaerota bacterium ZTH]|nr:CopG family transcriptional regulator [Lentisphaerota bacterium]WET05128.1 ribbon-helix-helix domain-containing protein [Lentisphaerota bacterium ZTH]
MPKQTRTEVITFKVDDSLKEALEGINNRSAFIRAAIMSALDSTCPLCKGTGILTPHQQKHWNEFRQSHSIEKCAECQAYFLQCKKNNP